MRVIFPLPPLLVAGAALGGFSLDVVVGKFWRAASRPACAARSAPDIKIVEGIKAVINDPAVVATAEQALKVAFGEKLSLTPMSRRAWR